MASTDSYIGTVANEIVADDEVTIGVTGVPSDGYFSVSIDSPYVSVAVG